MARMLGELMNQLWPTERLESFRARAGRIAASRLAGPRCYRELLLRKLGEMFPWRSNVLDALRRFADSLKT